MYCMRMAWVVNRQDLIKTSKLVEQPPPPKKKMACLLRSKRREMAILFAAYFEKNFIWAT